MSSKNNSKISNEINKSKIKKKIENKWKSFSQFFIDHFTNSFKLLIAYVIFVILGASLLYLPISLQTDYLKSDGAIYNFYDAIFTSSSAFSNTGLTITNVSKTFTVFGQVVLYIWIQLGGFGLLSAFYLVGKSLNKIFNKKILSNSWISYAERGGTKISNTGKVLFSIFFIYIFIQVLFSIIFSIIFYNVQFFEVIPNETGIWIESSITLPMYKDVGLSIWNAMFITGSAMNNAGFDLFGATSLAPFRNDIGILVQFLTMILFMIGGIGYVVVYDIWQKIEYFIYKKFPKKFITFLKINGSAYVNESPPISIFSKICLSAALFFSIISIGMTFISEYLLISNDTILGAEYDAYFNNDKLNSNWAIIYNTLSTRSAGFATMDMNVLNDISKWIFIFLMFLGTSPTSTGGGIRTTTFIVLIKSVISRISGRNETTIFKKRISKTTTIDSTSIFSLSVIIIIFLTILVGFLSMRNTGLINFDITDLAFEASSAFGTTGLSTGLTSKIGYIAYAPFIILMFFGQLGIMNSMQMFASRHSKRELTKYSDIEIKLG
ncbi:MAG: potassium transporter TrkG [Mycoplasmoidaceae bacterium]